MDARNPDEIVVAGLTPNKRRNSPFDSNHRGNSLILLIDLAILGYLAYLLADAGVQMFNSYIVNGVLFVQFGLDTEQGRNGLTGLQLEY